MGFAAGALFVLASAADAQTPPVPGKSLPPPQDPGQGPPAASGAPTGYYGGGYPAGTGRLSRRPAGYPRRVRRRPARLQPGRPGRAAVRAGGAARPGRRRLRPGALTVPRRGRATRPGPVVPRTRANAPHGPSCCRSRAETSPDASMAGRAGGLTRRSTGPDLEPDVGPADRVESLDGPHEPAVYGLDVALTPAAEREAPRRPGSPRRRHMLAYPSRAVSGAIASARICSTADGDGPAILAARATNLPLLLASGWIGPTPRRPGRTSAR